MFLFQWRGINCAWNIFPFSLKRIFLTPRIRGFRWMRDEARFWDLQYPNRDIKYWLNSNYQKFPTLILLQGSWDWSERSGICWHVVTLTSRRCVRRSRVMTERETLQHLQNARPHVGIAEACENPSFNRGTGLVQGVLQRSGSELPVLHHLRRWRLHLQGWR